MRKYLIFCFIIIAGSTSAQTVPDLPSSEIEIIKGFNARLTEASMLDIPLPAHTPDTNRAFIRQYKLSTQPIQLEYPAPQMKPLAMPREENPVGHPFYVKLGYGIQTNPFVEVAHYLVADRFNLTSHASFESVKDNNNDNKKFQDIDVHFDSNIELSDMLQLNAQASYLRQNRNLYATNYHPFEHDTEIVYDIPEVHLSIQNALETETNIDYELGYTYRHTKDNSFNKETNHRFEGRAEKLFEESDIRFELHGVAELNKLKGAQDLTLNNYIVGGLIGYNHTGWNLRGGIDLAILDDDIKIQPQAELNLLLSPTLRPYIGMRSGIEQNNYYSLTRDNPYSSRTLDALNNETTLTFYVGAQGEIERANYEVVFGYKMSENKALFINNYPDTSTFLVEYDDINTISIAIKGDVELLDGLNTGAGITFYSYNTDMADEAWHLPGLSWQLHARYSKLLDNKLTLTGMLNSLSGIQYMNPLGQSDNLNAQYDFSILADYKMNKNFYVFLHLNNLFDNQKENYFGYDRIGINPQIGVKVQL